MKSKLTVIIGASAGVGKALANESAACGENLLLVARDIKDLEAIANHLQITYNVEAFPFEADLESNDFQGQSLLEELKKHFPDYQINKLYLTAAVVDSKDEIGLEHFLLERINRINFLSLASLLTAFVNEFKNQSEGKAIVFSSIAAPVPRKKNIIYAASKNALESLCKSLQHEVADYNNVFVQVYRLGYVDTAMSFGQKLMFPVADPVEVARFVIKNSNKKNLRLVHYPGFWALIIFALKLIPWFVYKRLKF